MRTKQPLTSAIFHNPSFQLTRHNFFVVICHYFFVCSFLSIYFGSAIFTENKYRYHHTNTWSRETKILFIFSIPFHLPLPISSTILFLSCHFLPMHFVSYQWRNIVLARKCTHKHPASLCLWLIFPPFISVSFSHTREDNVCETHAVCASTITSRQILLYFPRES